MILYLSDKVGESRVDSLLFASTGRSQNSLRGLTDEVSGRYAYPLMGYGNRFGANQIAGTKRIFIDPNLELIYSFVNAWEVVLKRSQHPEKMPYPALDHSTQSLEHTAFSG